MKVWVEIWLQFTVKLNLFSCSLLQDNIVNVIGLDELMQLWRVAGSGLMEVTGIKKIGFPASLILEEIKTA